MKTNELMIGDWVCYDGDENFDSPVQIDIVDGKSDEVHVNNRWPCATWLKPIPITEDNLKLNDLVCVTSDDEFNHYTSKKQVGYSFAEVHFNKNAIVVNITNDETDRDFIGTLEYIHELQHALRLCGLNELADNWRVE